MKRLFLLMLSTGCGQVAPTSDAAASDAAVSDVGNDDSTTDVIIQDAPIKDAPAESSSDAGACTYLLSSLPCNSLPQSTLITAGCITKPPTPEGGTVVDGLYNLVHVDWDATSTDGGCPSGVTRRGTIEICGGTLLWLDYDDVGGVWRGDTSINTNNASISFQEFCSGNELWSFNYTTNGTNLVMFWQYPQGERLIMTFTRQ